MEQEAAKTDDAVLYQELLRAYIDSANDAIFVLCDEMKFLVCNRRMADWLGNSEEELTRHGARIPITALLGDDATVSEFSRKFSATLHGEPGHMDCYIKPTGGQPRWVELNMNRVNVENGDMVIVVARDITARKTRMAAMEHQATHDLLTGLPNWTLLRKKLGDVLEQARTATQSLAMLSISLDRFREVNNILGPRVGDEVLRQIARRLQIGLPKGTLIARHGGDEFSVYLPDTDRTQAEQWARRICSWLGRPFNLSELTGNEADVPDAGLDIAFSLGIAMYPEHGRQVDDLLRKAGVAVQVAKSRSGGIAFYDPEIDRRDADRLLIAGQLRRAIAEDALSVYFQPIVAIKQRQVAGVEALVRWPHPQRGLFMPEQFIPLAEQTGLVRLLDYWVLDRSLRQLQEWLREGANGHVAVNLSARTLDDARLAESIAETLTRWDIPAQHLRIELTESALMSNPEQMLRRLQDVSERGVSLALYDYGTGYSSLAHLKRLPLEWLKIDRSFVGDMKLNEDDAAIVRSTIELAHNLGLRVVAEGVEDEETWRMLVALGCDAVQGNYIAEPMPAEQLQAWLAKSAWKGS